MFLVKPTIIKQTTQLFTIQFDNQKLPVNLDKFRSSMLNKIRLQQYVFKWTNQNHKSENETVFGGV